MRKPRPLDDADLQHELREKAQALAAVGLERLLDEELIAGILYTGPTFVKYNAVLRALTKVPFMVRQCEQLNRGNRYTTTLHTHRM